MTPPRSRGFLARALERGVVGHCLGRHSPTQIDWPRIREPLEDAVRLGVIDVAAPLTGDRIKFAEEGQILGRKSNGVHGCHSVVRNDRRHRRADGRPPPHWGGCVV